MGSITTSLEAFCLRARRRITGRTEIGRARVGGLDRDGEELDRSGGRLWRDLKNHPRSRRSHPKFTLYNIFYRECWCEQGFGDPFYPNPGLIAPLRAREEIVSEGGDSPRQCFLSCFQSNICTDVV
jgi:hypothetical protein